MGEIEQIIDFTKAAEGLDLDEGTLKLLTKMSKAANSAIIGHLKNNITEDQVNKKLEDLIKKMDTKEALAPFKEELKDIKSTIGDLKSATEVTKTGKVQIKSIGDQIADQFKEFAYKDPQTGVMKLKSDDIRFKKGDKAGITLFVKAAPLVATTNNAGILAGVTVDNTLVSEPRQTTTVRDLANVAPISTPTVVYGEFVGVEGDAEWVPENGLKPAIKGEIEPRTVNVGKVAVMFTVTEEVMQDIPQLEAELELEGINKVALKEEDGIINGSGTGGEIKGVLDDIPAFSFDGISVDNPNEFDALVASSGQISDVSKMGYAATAVILNNADYLQMGLIKNTNGNYINPLVSNSERFLSGLRFIRTTNIPRREFIMGDFRYLNIRDYMPITVKFGWATGDYEHNRITVIIEKRLLAYIKGPHRLAFVRDDFDSVIAAISKIEEVA